jgi:glycosyltransferase involved in cell wall biosynthesis
VLHLINGEHFAGAERVQDLLALNLGRFGYSVAFACLKPGRFPGLRQSRSSELFELRGGGRFGLGAARAARRLILDTGACLVHSHSPRAGLAALLANRGGVPWVHHVHSPAARDTTRRWRDRLVARVERVVLRKANAVIAVSNAIGRYAIEQGVPPGRLDAIPNGVPALGPLPQRQVPGGVWTLGCVALFRPRKGLEVLLDALGIVRARSAAVRLLAVGRFETAEYEARIKSHCTRLGLDDHVTWRGFTIDVNRELAQMDLFVLPSLFGEGLPMVLLEAMAAGVPTVATRVEGIPEAIRDSVDGLLVAPNDALDLAQAIGAYLVGQVDWQAVRANAHARHVERFSDHCMAGAVAAVYDRLLKARAAKGHGRSSAFDENVDSTAAAYSQPTYP